MKSEKRTTVYFEASSADRLCELLGAYDENLKTLSAELGVEISVADGLTLKISGEKENVVLCEKALKAAAGAAEKGERIDERQIRSRGHGQNVSRRSQSGGGVQSEKGGKNHSHPPRGGSG